MLHDRIADIDDVRDDRSTPSPAQRERAAVGPTVARLCRALRQGDVLMVAQNEQRAEAIARAARAVSDALVLWCPPPETLPGDPAPSSPAVAGARVAALSALNRRGETPVLLVTDAAAATQLVPPAEAFATPPRTIRIGDSLSGEAFAEELEAIGYFRDERVDEAGEIAVRGGAVDIFPAHADGPVRIHLDDGRVALISAYDPVSQLGEDDGVESLLLYPAAEPAAGDDAVTIFDHLPQALVAIDPDAEARRDAVLELAKDPVNRAGIGKRKPRPASGARWTAALKERTLLDIAEAGEQPAPRFIEARRPAEAFLKAVKSARSSGERVVLAGSERNIRFLSRRLERRLGEAPISVSTWAEVEAAEPGTFLSIEAPFDRGWRDNGLLVVAAADILGGRAVAGAYGSGAQDLARQAAELHIGDAVIHEDHGLGILEGLEAVSADDVTGDAIRLVYASDAQRLVPIEEAGRLWRYGAEADAVSPDKLDGSTWARRRGEIDETIAETARGMIALAEERAARTAPKLEPRASDYERFAAGFLFTATPDQARAIAKVQDDLASGKPMDRLIVGDVGYGKTEVALRAAAIAALSGKQVALVAPTTVLVRQHAETFRRRFGVLGLRIEALSRLSPAAEARAVKAGLADGSVRIVVGTKMIAGKTVRFDDLGLVIIDEEQRFGAADKRKLRGLAEDIHVLTLTATPIPRTLQGALAGLQHVSVIATPPSRRQPTRTQIGAYQPAMLRGALRREQRRGGQSFVVVPRIEDMEPVEKMLAELVPDLTLLKAHGKMPAAEIDEQMIRFAGGDGDILLATNIVEAGLDIPRANTMIIWRADRFGLAQLHQLRGRVGRGRVRGQVLLVTEAGAELAPATEKRLRTLGALDQLGAGFAISARDLDLRGAGELLGEEQAGHMKLIGVGFYQHLLDQALRKARGETVEDWQPELNLGVSGRFPEGWIPEAELRINLYVRLSRISSDAELDALAEELNDRFGTLPPEAEMLLALARIRRLAHLARIARIDAGPAAIALTPRPDFAGDPAKALLSAKDGRLLLQSATEADQRRLDEVTDVLARLIPEGDPIA